MTRTPSAPGAARGFTLIELLIAIAIIGILLAIAVPSYTRHTIRSNRTAAQEFMLELASRETQYLADSRTYASSVSALNMATPAAVSAKYTLSFAADNVATPPTFTITATPISTTGQANDGVLTISNTGEKTPSDKW